MIHLPKKIVVLGIPYDVLGVPTVADVNEEGNGRLHGVCYTEQKKIRVSTEGCDELTTKVMLHEVLHAVMAETGLIVDREEDFVTRLTDGLFSCLPYMNVDWKRFK